MSSVKMVIVDGVRYRPGDEPKKAKAENKAVSVEDAADDVVEEKPAAKKQAGKTARNKARST